MACFFFLLFFFFFLLPVLGAAKEGKNAMSGEPEAVRLSRRDHILKEILDRYRARLALFFFFSSLLLTLFAQ